MSAYRLSLPLLAQLFLVGSMVVLQLWFSLHLKPVSGTTANTSPTSHAEMPVESTSAE